jgi:hypothetical protein
MFRTHSTKSDRTEFGLTTFYTSIIIYMFSVTICIFLENHLLMVYLRRNLL